MNINVIQTDTRTELMEIMRCKKAEKRFYLGKIQLMMLLLECLNV